MSGQTSGHLVYRKVSATTLPRSWLMVTVAPFWSLRENSGAWGLSVKTPPAKPLLDDFWRTKKMPPATTITSTSVRAAPIQARGRGRLIGAEVWGVRPLGG